MAKLFAGLPARQIAKGVKISIEAVKRMIRIARRMRNTLRFRNYVRSRGDFQIARTEIPEDASFEDSARTKKLPSSLESFLRLAAF